MSDPIGFPDEKRWLLRSPMVHLELASARALDRHVKSRLIDYDADGFGQCRHCDYTHRTIVPVEWRDVFVGTPWTLPDGPLLTGEEDTEESPWVKLARDEELKRSRFRRFDELWSNPMFDDAPGYTLSALPVHWRNR